MSAAHQMTSWANRWARRSGTLGIGKSARCELMKPSLAKALCAAANHNGYRLQRWR